MTVTRDEAASRLDEIDTARRRSLTLFNYGMASPYLLLWGGLWIVAGVMGAASPGNAGIGWLAVDVVGLAGTFCLVLSQSRRAPERSGRLGMVRFIGAAVVLAAFIALTFRVFAPVTGVQVQTFITLLVAATYAIVGCWLGLRYAVVGAALAALAAGAFQLAPAQLPLIVSLLGGGALVLGGVWMRRAR